MAVYERAYRGYAGSYTPPWSRFLVPVRFAFQSIFASRLFLAFFVACFFPALVMGVGIYISHNLRVLQFFGVQEGVVLIDSEHFMGFLAFEAKFLGFLLALIVAPALICPDMLNNALPLYLSRPFSRSEYLLGKLSVLIVLLSVITWIPYSLLFALNAGLSGGEWTRGHLYILWAILAGSWSWILTLSLISLAVSAVFQRKLWARVFLFVLLTALGAFGAILAETVGLWWGQNLNVFQMNLVMWGHLFRVPVEPSPPLWSACLTLATACGLSVALLYRRIRPYEIVR